MIDIEDIARSQGEAYARGKLPIWTVYFNPKDFPGRHVARRSEVGPEGALATDDILLGEIDDIRLAFAKCGLVKMTRSPGDDPVIVECWI